MFNKKKLTNLRSVRSTCEEDLKVLEATIASLVNSNSDLRKENAKLNAEISVLESNYNNLQADLNAYDDIIGNFNLTIEDLRAQVTSLMNENNKLQNELNAEKAKVTSLTNDKNSLTNQLNTANSTISSLNSQINSLNSQVTTLTAEKISLMATIDFLVGCDVEYDAISKEFFLKLGRLNGQLNSSNGEFFVDEFHEHPDYMYRFWILFTSTEYKNIYLDVTARNSQNKTNILSTSCLRTFDISLMEKNNNLYLKFKNISLLENLRELSSFDSEVKIPGANDIRNILRFLFKYCAK